MSDRSRPVRVAAFLLAMLAHAAPFAAESYALAIKEHRFDPAEIEVPAGQKFKLLVRNEDGTPEEFESKTLRLEKVVKGHKDISFNVGPLKPGVYEFVGEFHEATAQGRLVAK